jgi:hypothetical protein
MDMDKRLTKNSALTQSRKERGEPQMLIRIFAFLCVLPTAVFC